MRWYDVGLESMIKMWFLVGCLSVWMCVRLMSFSLGSLPGFMRYFVWHFISLFVSIFYLLPFNRVRQRMCVSWKWNFCSHDMLYNISIFLPFQPSWKSNSHTVHRMTEMSDLDITCMRYIVLTVWTVIAKRLYLRAEKKYAR